MNVFVDLGPRSYDIIVTHDDLAGIGAFARERCMGQRAFVVSDENAARYADVVTRALAGADFEADACVLPAGEARKSLATASQLYDRLAEMQADRRTLIVAVGGGVMGDLAGFVAATFNRGLPLLMAPTTLLSMVDSSVGGKVAVNHPRGKNLIGAFHQPVGVWIDTAVLASLPEGEYRSGLAEVVKYGVILDADFFSFLEDSSDAIQKRDADVIARIVARCCRLKADVVEKDEREETGVRAVLNYGHTFAHAFETNAGYGAWRHGEAVAAGMICASRLAERRGLIGPEVTKRQRDLLEKLALPVAPLNHPIDELIATMRRDKKALAGKLRFILPRKLGAVALFDDVPDDDVRKTLEELMVS